MSARDRLEKIAASDPPELRDALRKVYASIAATLDDLVERLDKIDQTPLPLWLQSQMQANPALVDERSALTALAKSAGAATGLTDAELLARLLADPAVAARARSFDPGRNF